MKFDRMYLVLDEEVELMTYNDYFMGRRERTDEEEILVLKLI